MGCVVWTWGLWIGVIDEVPEAVGVVKGFLKVIVEEYMDVEINDDLR